MGNQNKSFHKKASHGGGPVKDTTDGKSLHPNATNVIGGTKRTSKPLGPNANKAARK